MASTYGVRQRCVQARGIPFDMERGHGVFIEEMSCDIR